MRRVSQRGNAKPPPLRRYWWDRRTIRIRRCRSRPRSTGCWRSSGYWNVINYFFPYKHLLDRPWSTVLTDFIPRFVANTSTLDYQTTIAEMVVRMQDSHGSARGLQALNDHLGAFAPPVRLASAGGALVVVEVFESPGGEASVGLARGDVILAIDGAPVAERLAALSRLRALSTPQAAYAFVYPAMLRGAKDSRVTVQARGVDGAVRM